MGPAHRGSLFKKLAARSVTRTESTWGSGRGGSRLILMPRDTNRQRLNARMGDTAAASALNRTGPRGPQEGKMAGASLHRPYLCSGCFIPCKHNGPTSAIPYPKDEYGDVIRPKERELYGCNGRYSENSHAVVQVG